MGELKIKIITDDERDVFRVFAECYPQEAAECNFPEFAAFVRSRARSPLTDGEIERLLTKVFGAHI